MTRGTITFTKTFESVGSCDVLVAGGGIAGTMAAIASARAGANTVLLERYGFLGGIATGWGQICFCGDTAGQGDVFDELLGELERLAATEPYTQWDPQKILEFDHEADWRHSPVARQFDASAMRIVLAQMVVRQPNLRICLHTKIVDTVHNEGAVEAVVFHNVSGLQAIEPLIVIDCTGDAHLAASCVSCMQEWEAPVPLAGRISLIDIGRDVTPVLPDWGPEYLERVDMSMVHLSKNIDGKVTFRTNLAGHDPMDADELTEAEIRSQTDALAIACHLQEQGYATYRLDSLATEIGIRIGRRIAGQYVLTGDDARRGAQFADAVARGTCNLTTGYLDSAALAASQKALNVEVVPAYQIPYRSLVPAGGENILAAGRCISADRWALSSARMIPTAAMTGQAAGLAAARSVEQGGPVAQVDVKALQGELKSKGAVF